METGRQPAEDRGPVEGVKGVFQIDLENSQRSSVTHGSNEPVQRVRNGLTATRNAHSDLKRSELRGGFLARKTKSLGNKSAQDLTNYYGSYATIFFLQRKKTGSAQVGSKGGRSLTTSKKIDNVENSRDDLTAVSG